MAEGDGHMLKVVAVDLGSERATIMNVAMHTIPVKKLGRVVAVVSGKLCPKVGWDCAEDRCLWCTELRFRCEQNRKC